MVDQTLPFTETQSEQILRAMQAGRRITPVDALNDFGCFRLGGRVYDLKQMGHDIKDEWVKLKSGKRVKRYFMEG